MDITETDQGSSYTVKFNEGNILQLRQVQSEFWVFQKFRIGEDDKSGFRQMAGSKLKAFCRAKSIIIGTNDREQNKPVAGFLEDSGFMLKYSKRMYQKSLSGNESNYKDIFSYHSISEIGLTDFLSVFEKTVESEKPAAGEAKTTFGELSEFAGERYDPSKWYAVRHGSKYIGITLPVAYNDEAKSGTVFYIGLLPEERNKGYGRIIHARSLDMLKEMGAKNYFGSTETTNKPMIRLFEINGCKATHDQLFYHSG